MSLNLGTKVLAGAIAMAIGGAAMANTNLDATTTGDVFLNIVNSTNDTSFLYDTGISQANFTSSTTFSVNLQSDPNYQAFISASGSSPLAYSVESGLSNGSTKANQFSVDVTGIISPLTNDVSRGNLAASEEAMSGFLTGANTIASTTTNSALVSGIISGLPAFWGAGQSEGVVSQNLFSNPATFDDSTAPGTALAFYQESFNGGITTLGTWDLNGNVATFVGANVGVGTSPVPLPTPLLLLLSGLGLMGVVARRGKPSADLASDAATV
jgi:hypothetical protein